MVAVRIPGADSIDSVAPARDPGVQANPEDFGAGVGQSTANFGASLVSLSAHMYAKQQDAADQVSVQTNMVNMAPAIAKAHLENQAAFPDGGPASVNDLNARLFAAKDGVAAAMKARGLEPSKAAQARIDTQFAGMQSNALVSGTTYSINANVSKMQSALDDNNALVASNVLSGKQSLENGLSTIPGNVAAGKSLYGGQAMRDKEEAWQHAVIDAAIRNKYDGGDRAGGDAISDKYYGNVPRFGDSNAAAVVISANRLGIAPRNLAAVMSYETGGRFDPNMMGGKGGNYQGLIQFGPEERARYGVKPGMTFAEQMPAVENYLRDRGLKPGMDLAQLYSIVNAGSLDQNGQPRWAASDGNGNIASHVQNIQRDHYANADSFLSGAGAGGAKSVKVANADSSAVIPGAGKPNADASGDQSTNSSGDNAPVLPDVAKALYWRQQSQLTGNDTERQNRIQAAQAKRVSDDAENQIIADVFSPTPKTTEVGISDNPALTPGAKMRMLAFVQRSTKDEPAAKISTRTSMDIVGRMGLPDGDPQKVSSEEQIRKAYTDGNLTRADYEFDVKRLDAVDGTPLSKKRALFEKDASNSIELAALGSGSMTGGAGTFNKSAFLQDVQSRIDSYRAEKKDPAHLFEQGHPDYLGKTDSNGRPFILKPYMPNAQKDARDAAATIPTPASSPAERQRLDEWVRARGGAPTAPIPIVPVSQ
jgi:hypothetical protein